MYERGYSVCMISHSVGGESRDTSKAFHVRHYVSALPVSQEKTLLLCQRLLAPLLQNTGLVTVWVEKSHKVASWTLRKVFTTVNRRSKQRSNQQSTVWAAGQAATVVTPSGSQFLWLPEGPLGLQHRAVLHTTSHYYTFSCKHIRRTHGISYDAIHVET